MPLIGLAPKTQEIEEILAARMGEIRPLFKKKVNEEWGVGEHDVVVDLRRCNIRDADPDAADVVILLETNPNEEIERKANRLRDELAKIWIDLGLGLNMRTEFWPRFVPGPWCAVRNNQVLDQVDHPVSF